MADADAGHNGTSTAAGIDLAPRGSANGRSGDRPRRVVKTSETVALGIVQDIVARGLTTGDRYVKLAFHQKGAAHDGEIRVRAPKLPAQAIPGIYMLFVVDKAGVPSVGKQVRLEPETHGDRRVFEHEDREDGIEAHSRTNDR